MKTLLRPALIALALALGAPSLAQTKSDSALPANLFLTSPPAAPALSPSEAKKTVKVGDTITLAGRVGGSKSPFVSGRAVLTIVGDGLPACSDSPDDHCKIPWDYCCETKADIARHSATIQIVDAAGKPLRVDLMGKNGIAELAALTVIGKVAQVSDKALVVNASSIFINPALPHGFFRTAKPADAKPVEEIKPGAKVGDTVSIIGRVGGSAEPFDASRAVFTIVGPGLAPCSAAGDSACKTLWDFCRQPKDQLAKHSATIQVVDDKGQPLALNLQGRGNLAPLSSVAVTGKVVKAEGDTLTIAATSIHIESKP